jgi:hypothetical protein
MDLLVAKLYSGKQCATEVAENASKQGEDRLVVGEEPSTANHHKGEED